MNENEPIKSKHRISAVMFLDMVGYSALMSRSAPRALAKVKELETILKDEIPAAGGRLIKLLGDGAMAEFNTSVAALSGAQKILERIALYNRDFPAQDRFQVRIGLHLGELVEERGDLFGDSVNIAARVQPLSDPGGIALTGTLYAQVKNQMTLRGAYLPPVKLKNIPEKMRIFLIPPAVASFKLWLIRKRFSVLPSWVPVAAILSILVVGGMVWQNYSGGPTRLGLLYIRTQESETEKKMARQVESQLNQKFSSLPEIQWVDRGGVLDLFSQEGIEDPEAIERMEVKACRAARRGGLTYTLICNLELAGKSSWRLNSIIVCTKIRSVVGTFSAEGNDADLLTENTLNQFKNWLRSL